MATRLVLGGGLGGLASAKYLKSSFPNDTIRILESSGRTGGYVKSVRVADNVIFEQGPRTIRPKGEAGESTLQLIEELNLQHEIVPINSKHPAATNRMIYAHGKLHLLPTKLTALFSKQAPFSKPLISYLVHDFTHKNKNLTTEDESIYEFANRRFGQEVADYLISPVICGICAGNAKEISVNFLMERLYKYEKEYGNITSGVLNNLFKGDENVPHKPIPHNKLIKRAKNEKWAVYSFKNGLETLPNRLTKYLYGKGVKIDLNTNITEIHLSANKAIAKTDKEDINAEHLISSISAKSLSKLVDHEHPKLAEFLKQIPTVTVAVINLKYNGNHIKNDAFGFLTPPSENLPILGVIFDSCCFKYTDHTVLTVMMGGFWFKKYFGNNPTETYLLNVAKEQIAKILNIKDEPAQHKVTILKDCIPQYVVGHKNNVKNIENYIKNYKLPLSLCGASFYGVGINDVILGAKAAVQNIK